MRQSFMGFSGLIQVYLVILIIFGWVWVSQADSFNPMLQLLSIFQGQ